MTEYNLSTIHGAILNSCQKRPNKNALVGYGGRGTVYTYGETSDNILKLSAVLKTVGVKYHDRVGLLSENCPEWGISYLSILASGGTTVPLDPALKENELARFLRISGISHLICSDKLFDKAKEIVVLNGLDIKLLCLNSEHPESFLKLKTEEIFVTDETQPDDMAAIIYTSGTTGDPKGVILTHKNLVANVNSIVDVLVCSEKDTMLSLLPLYHTFEATTGFLHALHEGLTIIYARALNSRDMLEDIKRNQVTCMVGVPILFEKMYNAINRKIKELPLLKRTAINLSYNASKLGWKFNKRLGRKLFTSLREKASLGSVRMFVSGGAPLPPRVAEWFNLIGFDFIEGYGLTECSPVVSANRPDDTVFGSVGSPLPGVEVKIDKPDEYGIGEVLIKGDNVTPGYLDNQEETDKLFHGGWLYSGDYGKLVKGNLFITGRKKNLIVSGGGKNIYPEEIEAELNLSEYILESVVIGREISGKTGEKIWAVVVPDMEVIGQSLDKSPDKVDPEQIRKIIGAEIKMVNSRISDYKRIDNFEIRIDEFEKTSTKKIKRLLYK